MNPHASKVQIDDRLSHYPQPQDGDSPLVYADRLSTWYAQKVSKENRRANGQYFTPVGVARFMAEFNRPAKDRIRILDPGAGTGILSCALIEHLVKSAHRPLCIQLDAFEIDAETARLLEISLQFAGRWLRVRNSSIDFNVIRDDFVLTHGDVLNPTSNLFKASWLEPYDMAISNPPYFKISKKDKRAQLSSDVVHGQPNIYMLFMAIAASLLRDGGHLTFITPRSFTAGPYFTRFRQYFFEKMEPVAVHVFGSRTEAFAKDSVLQENAILHARRVSLSRQESEREVRISQSNGISDLAKSLSRLVRKGDVFDADSNDYVLRIPIADTDDAISNLVNRWTEQLRTLGLAVSTGPVVPFRATPFISKVGTVAESHAPLLWMQNIKPMRVEWPRATRKEQYIAITGGSESLLVPNKNYVLLRRFSAKEDRRRLIAAPLLKETLDCQYVGIENHLNYIYRPKGGLTKEEALGIAAILNSEILDTYFRISNGNTQVSAAEVRRLPFPTLPTIKRIGRAVQSSPNLEDVESIVGDALSRE